MSTPSNGIDITDSTGTAHHINLTDGSAAGVASAINAAGLGVRAALVNTSSGQIMQLTGTSTGASNSFSISGTDSAAQTLSTAQDAQITIGNPAAGGYTMTSSTNTFTGVLPGVTFTVGAVASNVTVSVSSDTTSISNNVKAMVDAANSVLSELASDTGKGGPLETNYQINAITQSVLNLVSHGDSSGNSFAGLGIQLTSTGTFKFDPTAFQAAYTANPSATQSTLSALAASTSSTASNSSLNTVSPLITSGNSQVSNLTKQISDWDTRLADQQTALQAKYTAMEVALQKIKSTSSWLTSALASATGQTNSSSSSSSSG
ncbi:MAG TPA: flagellar filament capping protein FliD [Jatrophihabitans sp.]|nr:flagellar filament capping protein FliD [Jatrophihabitans sp.]